MQGLPAAFAHEAFGSFLDGKESAPITASAAKTVYDLIDILSHSYVSTDTTACKCAVAKALGVDFVGVARGREAQLMEEGRLCLLQYLRDAMPEETAFINLDPSSSIVSPDLMCAFTS